MAETLIFRMPLPLNLANSRMHHMVKHREKVAYWAMLDLLVKGKILPKPPKGAPWDKATISSAMVLGAQMDTDNSMNRHKWICDFLKKRKYIVDDSPKHLTWTGFPTQQVSRMNVHSITITLTKVGE